MTLSMAISVIPSDSERLLVLMESARSSAYDRLAETINRRMRMLHNYQPLMLMELLGRSSPAPTEDIARRILGKDSSQIESTTEMGETDGGAGADLQRLTSHTEGV